MDSELAANLAENAPDALVYTGTDGVIAVWNAAAGRIFGHAASVAIGQSLDLIIPEDFRERHWTGFDRALEVGETKYFGQALTTRALRADGATIYVELGFSMIHDPEGKTIGALASARDITERFNRDRETRRDLRELREAAKP